jgi:hypothetical protein
MVRGFSVPCARPFARNEALGSGARSYRHDVATGRASSNCRPVRKAADLRHSTQPPGRLFAFSRSHARFNSVMQAHFEEAEFWAGPSKATVVEWKGSQVPRITREPSEWQTDTGYKPCQDEFWYVSIAQKETRWIWKLLRDAPCCQECATSSRA